MNDSRLMRTSDILTQASMGLGVVMVIVTALGCANADSFRTARMETHSKHETLVETQVDSALTFDPIAKAVSEPTAVHASLASSVTPLAPPSPRMITLEADADLRQAILRSPGPVLLDFYADWCGPCRQQGQILHQIEDAATESQTTIIKINVDTHRVLAQQLGVASLPTLMMIRDGRVTQRQTGIASKHVLTSWMR
ncbi:MAG: thioredoxin family protein [Planctomycetota bacterium]